MLFISSLSIVGCLIMWNTTASVAAKKATGRTAQSWNLSTMNSKNKSKDKNILANVLNEDHQTPNALHVIWRPALECHVQIDLQCWFDCAWQKTFIDLHVLLDLQNTWEVPIYYSW